MAVTIETTTRREIRMALSAKYGSLSNYCLQRRIPYTTLTNLLKGNVSRERHGEIIKKVNSDTGADMSAWEK
jgi:hypothetical protein